jgi:hypothetical protein
MFPIPIRPVDEVGVAFERGAEARVARKQCVSSGLERRAWEPLLEITSVRRPRRWQGVEGGGIFYKRSCMYINSGSPTAPFG